MIKNSKFQLSLSISRKWNIPLIICLVAFWATTAVNNKLYAQSGKSEYISIEVKNTEIKDILTKIKDQYGYVFFYSTDTFDDTRKVSIKVENESIRTVLSILLRGTNNEYSISGNKVYIIEKKQDSKIKSGGGGNLRPEI